MTRTLRTIAELQQLLRLRGLREDAARRAREASRARHDEALQAVRDREAALEDLRIERRRLIDFTVGPGATQIPRLVPVAGGRSAWLADRIERTEYALIDDEEALSKAQAALDTAQRAWLQACARHEAVRALLEALRQRAARDREQRQEREVEPRRHGVTDGLAWPREAAR